MSVNFTIEVVNAPEPVLLEQLTGAIYKVDTAEGTMTASVRADFTEVGTGRYRAETIEFEDVAENTHFGVAITIGNYERSTRNIGVVAGGTDVTVTYDHSTRSWSINDGSEDPEANRPPTYNVRITNGEPFMMHWGLFQGTSLAYSGMVPVGEEVTFPITMPFEGATRTFLAFSSKAFNRNYAPADFDGIVTHDLTYLRSSSSADTKSFTARTLDGEQKLVLSTGDVALISLASIILAIVLAVVIMMAVPMIQDLVQGKGRTAADVFRGDATGRLT
jgi:hypothetical protein